MNEREHSDKLFDFHAKHALTLAESAAKIFKSFVDQKPQLKISLSIV